MPRAKKAPAVPYNTGNNEKIEPPPGRAYGARAATETALSLVPAAGPDPVQAPGPGPVAPTRQAGPAEMLAAAQQYQPDAGLLDGPSENPNEPVTAGLASGPGMGPGGLAMPNVNMADVQTWRAYLPTLEYLAAQPNSTQSTRNFVRRLRAAMPPATP